VQPSVGKFEGDASADQAATRNDRVVALHGAHSSAPGAETLGGSGEGA
jgi:hypothetical protein